MQCHLNQVYNMVYTISYNIQMSGLSKNAINNSLVSAGIFSLPKFTSTLLLPDSYTCFLLLDYKLLTKYVMTALFFFQLFRKLSLALALALLKD